MSTKTRTTVYIDTDLYVLGKGMGLNFSEVCNHALAGVVGVKYGSDKELIRLRTQEMVDTVKRKYEEESSRFEAEYRADQEKRIREEIDKDLEVHREEILIEVLGDLYHPSYLHRLPENDYHGDYLSWWADFSNQVSGRAGFRVQATELQQLIRSGVI